MLETVSAKELDRYAEEDGVLIFDLRPHVEYRAAHIRGAYSVPQGQFGERMPDRNRTLVLYCDRGALSMAVARTLAAKGYRVKTVVGGFRAYRGTKLETGEETGKTGYDKD